MKIALVTTLPSLVENQRIEDEIKNLGYEFTLVDMQDFGFEIENNKLNVEKLTGLTCDIVILRGVFLAIKTISVIINGLRNKGIKVFDNNFLEHRYSIDKVTDLVKLADSGISVPDTYYSRDFSKYFSFAKKLGYPLVIKSSRMGKGANVYLIKSDEELKNLISESEGEGKTAKGFLVQKFIDYAFDLRVLVIGERVFTMRRIPGEGEFRANFSLGGSVEPYNLDREGSLLARSAMGAVDMTVGGVDILIDKENKRYILEVNHTAGFVGMEKATSENIGKVFVEHAIANAK